MGARKYAGDYRLENVPGKGGKLRTVPVYRGAFYRFSSPPDRLRRAKKNCIIFLCAASVGLLLPMLLTGELLRRWYVLFPLVLALVPAFGLWRSAYHLLRAGERVIREHKEQMQERFAARSIALLILAVLSLAGQIGAYLSGVGREGWLVTPCTALVILSSIFLFFGKKDLLLEPIPEAE